MVLGFWRDSVRDRAERRRAERWQAVEGAGRGFGAAGAAQEAKVEGAAAEQRLKGGYGP